MNQCKCGCGNFVKGMWHQGHNRRGVPPTNKIGFTICDGYVWIWRPYHHRARKDTGYVKRCNIVAEQNIGRALRPGECVHPVNSIKNDDRPENLTVLMKRVHDKVSMLLFETCTLAGCGMPHRARGLCSVHYGRYYRAKQAMPYPATRRGRWG